MRIGSSIFLIALGAILALAIPDVLDFVDLAMVGYILIASGVVGLLLTVILQGKKRNRVTESRSAVDPGTGESVVRNETIEDGSPRSPLL